MLIGKIGLVTVLVDPFLDFLFERDEIGEKDGVDGKELVIGLDDVEGVVKEKDDILYLHEKAVGISLAAFRGGVEGAAHGEVEHQGLDAFLQGVGFVCFHGCKD